MDNEFKQILSEFPNENGLNQSELARRTGMKAVVVSRVRGKSKPGYDALRAIYKAFDVTVIPIGNNR